MPNQSFSQNQDLSKEIKLKDTTLIVTTLRSHSDICAIMCYNPVHVPIWSCLFLSLWGIWGTITPEKCSKSFIYPEVKQGLYMLLIGSRSTHPPNEWKRTLRQLTSPDLSNWSCLSSPHVHCLLCYALYTFSATSFFFCPWEISGTPHSTEIYESSSSGAAKKRSETIQRFCRHLYKKKIPTIIRENWGSENKQDNSLPMPVMQRGRRSFQRLKEYKSTRVRLPQARYILSQPAWLNMFKTMWHLSAEL